MKNRPLPLHAKRYSEQAEKVFSGVRFDVYQWQQKLFDGTTTTFEIVKRNDTVVILGVIDDQLVLLKEEQPHWGGSGLVVPAGMVNPDEDLAVAARRELEEETGLLFSDYTLVHIESPAPSVEWFTYTFIASGYQGEKAKQLDPGEKNEIVKVSLDELITMTKNRELFYRPRFIEDMLMQDKVTGLRDMIKNPSKYSIKNKNVN